MHCYITRFLVSSLIVLLPLFQVKPCSDYYMSDDVRVTNFMDNALNFNQLTKYVFTTDYYMKDYDVPLKESYKENIEQWFLYCSDKNVERKDIYDFLYVLSGEDLANNKQRLLIKNSFLRALKGKQDVLDYLFLIKREPAYSFHTTWDDFANENYRSPYYDEGQLVYNTKHFDSLLHHTKDAFLKRRYAYQSLIAHFYHEAGNAKDILNVFNTFFKDGKKDWMYYSALHYAAYVMPNQNEERLNCIINGSDKQARNIELLYASPTFKRFLATETDPIKRSYLLAVRAIRNMGPCLSDLQEIYKLNPKNIYFDFLLNREVNKIEDWILTPELTSFKPYTGSEQAARNYQKDLVYTNTVLEFTSQLTGTNNEVFLALVNSYLNYVLNRPEKAFEILKSKKYAANETFQLQARTIALLIQLSAKQLNQHVENEIVQLIKLSPSYMYRNQLIRSCGSLLYKIPEYRAKAFLLLSQSWYPKEYYGNDLYSNLYEHASVKEMYQVISLINTSQKSPFEQFIYRMNNHLYSWEKEITEEWISFDTLKIKNIIAMQHINFDELEKALAVYKTFPEAYWENSYFDDPFTFSIFDGHNHSKSDKIGYTKKQFLEKLIAYKKELTLKPNDPVLNYYIGNAYLSLTWFGKNWYMADMSWSIGGFKYREKTGSAFENNYFKFSRALPYIKKAADNTSDKKIQTLAKLHLAFCYSNIKNKKLEDLLDYNTRTYYTEVKLNCDVYVQYLNQYRLVDLNYSPVVKLKRFEYFDDNGRYY